MDVTDKTGQPILTFVYANNNATTDYYAAEEIDHEYDLPCNTVILSIDHSDYFLHYAQLVKGISKEERSAYIKKHEKEILGNARKNQLAIIEKIMAAYPGARIILCTQAFPSPNYNTELYTLMRDTGIALALENPEPIDVMHRLMSILYKDIKKLTNKNIVVADLTSTLNPFNKRFYNRRLQLSNAGKEKKQALLARILTDATVIPDYAYRLQEDRLQEDRLSPSMFAKWEPLHPFTHVAFDAHAVLNNIALDLKKCNTKDDAYNAYNNIHVKGRQLLLLLQENGDESTQIYQALRLAFNLHNGNSNEQDLQELRDNTSKLRQQIIDSSYDAKKRQRLGLVLGLFGAVALLACIFFPMATPLFIGLGVAAAVATCSGIGLFAHSYRSLHFQRQQTTLADACDRLADATAKTIAAVDANAKTIAPVDADEHANADETMVLSQ